MAKLSKGIAHLGGDQSADMVCSWLRVGKLGLHMAMAMATPSRDNSLRGMVTACSLRYCLEREPQ